jgi:hypothetical protein
VLKDRGWRIHRIWSTDWFHRRQEQLQKVIAAIEKARLESEIDEEAEAEQEAAQADAHDLGTRIERGEPIEQGNGQTDAAWVMPYKEANFGVPSTTPIPDTNLPTLTDIVVKVVEIEGPIHREEVARRITSLWGRARTGNRISESISRAIQSGIRSGDLRADLEFVSHTQQSAVPVRCRSNVTKGAANLKNPEMIPPAELRQAIHYLVADHVGLGRGEIPATVAKVLGFKAASAKLKDVIDKVLAHMVEENRLALRDEKLFLP